MAPRVLPEELSENFVSGEHSRVANGEVRNGYRGTWGKPGVRGRKRPELGEVSTGLGRTPRAAVIHAQAGVSRRVVNL